MLGSCYKSKNLIDFIHTCFFSHNLRSLFCVGLTSFIIFSCENSHAQQSLEEIELVRDSIPNSFWVNGVAESNITVFEGNSYKLINGSTEVSQISIREGNTTFMGVNSFNTVADNIRNYIFWEPLDSSSLELNLTDAKAPVDTISIFVDSYDYSQSILSPVQAGSLSHFGSSISLESENQIIIGAPHYNEERGRAFVYNFDENSKDYNLFSVLDPPLDTEGQFGSSLSSSDGWLAIGSPMNNQSAGAIYLFEKIDSGYQLRSEVNGTANQDYFGLEVSMQTKQLAVSSLGEVNFFTLNEESNHWAQNTNLSIVHDSLLDGFGFALDFRGEFLIVGAPFFGATGATYIYQKNADGWLESFISMPTSVETGAQFGFAVAIDPVSQMAAVSAPFNNFSGNGSGSVYLFSLVDGNWEESAVLLPPSAGLNQNFGHSIELVGGVLAISAPGSGGNGKVYLYRKSNEGTLWDLISTLDLDDEGFASVESLILAFDEKTLVVGAPQDQNTNGRVATFHGPGWKDYSIPSLSPLISSSTLFDFNMSEDSTDYFSYDFNYTHPFDSNATWHILNENAYGKSDFDLNISTGKFKYLPDANFSGTHTFHFGLMAQEESSSFYFSINVVEENDAPRFLEMDPFLPSGTIGTSYSYSIQWDDADDDSHTLTVLGNLPPGLDLDGSILNGIPQTEGDYNFTIQIDDGFVQVDYNFSLNIYSVNSPPSIRWKGEEVSEINLYLQEDFSPTDWQLVLQGLNITDLESDDLTVLIKEPTQQYNAQNGSLLLNNSQNTNFPISYFPNHNYFGSDQFTLVVQDDHPNSLSSEVKFTLAIEPVNDPPILIAHEPGGSILPAPMSLELGVFFVHTFATSDPDINDVVAISFSTLPSWLSFDGNRTISGTPWSEDFLKDPSPSIFVYVRDQSGAVSIQFFKLILEPSNYPPIIDVDEAVTFSIIEDSTIPFSFELNATDADSNITDLAWDLIVEPEHGTVQLSNVIGNNTLVSYLPKSDFSGDDSFEVRIFNPSFPDSSDSVIFIAEVNGTQDAPQITSTPFNNIIVNVPWEYRLTVFDPDPDEELSLDVTDLPTWLHYQKIGRDEWLFQGIPSNLDSSYIEIILDVTDSYGNFDQQFLDLYVLSEVEEVQVSPKFTDTQFLNEDSNWTVDLVTVSNGSNRKLSWLFTEEPSNGVVSFDEVSNGVLQNLTYTPFPNFHGSDSFCIQASDGFGSDDLNITLVVDQVEDSTAWQLPPDLLIQDEQSYDQTIEYFDGDGLHTLGELSVTVFPENSWLSIDKSPELGRVRLHGVAPSETNESYLIIATLSDLQNQTLLEGNFSLEVSFHHQSPQLESHSLELGSIFEDSNYIHAEPLSATDDITASEDLIWDILIQPNFGTASINNDGSDLSYQPLSNSHGQDSFTVQVSDLGSIEGDPKSTELEVEIFVDSVEDTPSFITNPIVSVFSGEEYVYEVEVVDPDLPQGLFPQITARTILPSWLTLNNHGHGKATLVGMPKFYHEGNYTISLECSDFDGFPILQNFNLEVQVDDYPPKIINRLDGSIITKINLVLTEDQDLKSLMNSHYIPDFNATNIDRESDDLQDLNWSVHRYPTSGNILNVSGLGPQPEVLNYTLAENFSGTDYFSISVSEGDTFSLLEFEVLVSAQPDNPVWVKVPQENTNIDAGSFFSFQLEAVDADADSLDYQLTSMDKAGSWLGLKNVDGEVFLEGFAPRLSADTNNFAYLLKVSDVTQRVNFTEFQIVTQKANNPPVIQSVSDSLFVVFDFEGRVENQDLFPMHATDIDGDALVWSILKEPSSGFLTLAQRNDRLLNLNFNKTDDTVLEDFFTLRVSDGFLHDELKIHAFFDRKETSVNLINKLPTAFSGDNFNYDFSAFSNVGIESIQAKILDGPDWLKPIGFSDSLEGWSRNFSLSGLIPQGVAGEEFILIEIKNPNTSYHEVFEVLLPIVPRTRDMNEVTILLEQKSESFDSIQLKPDSESLPELRKNVPINFQGNLVKILEGDDCYFLLGNFKGEVMYGKETVGYSESTAGFVFSLDLNFSLIDHVFFESQIIATIADADLSLDQEIIVVGNFVKEIGTTGQKKYGLGGNDIYIAVVNADPSNLVVRQLSTFGGISDEIVSDVSIDGTDVYLAGTFRDETNFGTLSKKAVGSSDGFVGKTSINSLNKFFWLSSFGSSGKERIRDILILNGKLFLAANFENSLRVGNTFMRGNGVKSSFIAKLDSHFGTVLNTYRINGEGDIILKGLVGDEESNNLIGLGEFSGQVVTDQSKVNASDFTDLFLMKFSSDLKPRVLHAFAGTGTEQWDEWYLGDEQSLYLSGNFNKSFTLNDQLLFSKNGKDAFLLKVDYSSVKIKDFITIQSESDDRIESIFHSQESGTLLGTKSPYDFKQSDDNAISHNKLNSFFLNQLRAPPSFKTLFPQVLPAENSFRYPFETFGWSVKPSSFTIDVKKLPDWVNIKFYENNASGFFYGVSPLISESREIILDIILDENGESTSFNHVLNLSAYLPPTFLADQKNFIVYENETFSFSVDLYDHDSSNLSVSYQIPEWIQLKVGKAGELVFEGLTDEIGTHGFSLMVRDDQSLESSESFTVEVKSVLPASFTNEKVAYDAWVDTWLGMIFTKDSGWSYHVNLGWILIKADSGGQHLWLWNDGWGWLWTSKKIWNSMSGEGHLYSQSKDSWLYFKMTKQDGKRLIYLQEEKSWLDY